MPGSKRRARRRTPADSPSSSTSSSSSSSFSSSTPPPPPVALVSSSPSSMSSLSSSSSSISAPVPIRRVVGQSQSLDIPLGGNAATAAASSPSTPQQRSSASSYIGLRRAASARSPSPGLMERDHSLSRRVTSAMSASTPKTTSIDDEEANSRATPPPLSPRRGSPYSESPRARMATLSTAIHERAIATHIYEKFRYVDVAQVFDLDVLEAAASDERNERLADAAATLELTRAVVQLLRRHRLVLLDVDAYDVETIVERAIDAAIAAKAMPALAREDAIDAVMSAELECSQAVGNAFDIWPGRVDDVDEVLIFVRLKHAVNFLAADMMATKFVWIYVVGDDVASHEVVGDAIGMFMCEEEFHDDAFVAVDTDELLTAGDAFILRLQEGAAAHRRLHHLGEHIADDDDDESSPLARTGVVCGGFLADLARYRSRVVSDFKDGLHPRVLAATLYLYFCCLTPAIAFGAAMQADTEGHIGVTEMLIASGIVKCLYSLFAGQPMSIVGGTGPMLVFTKLLHDVSLSLPVTFLQLYAVTGLWTAFFLLIIVAADGAALVRFATRFTDEVFSVLVSVIFIQSGLKPILALLTQAQSDAAYSGALLTLLVAIFVVFVLSILRNARRSHYLGKGVRVFLADFSGFIAISLGTVLNYMLDTRGYAPKIAVTLSSIRATDDRDSWLVDISSVPVDIIFLAIIPALLATLLVFMDHNHAVRLLNSADNRLRKPVGYHLDSFVVALAVALCSLVGFPFMIAATVRSLNHLRSLAVVEAFHSSDGRWHEHIVRVHEQRVSGLILGVLLVLSLVARGLLSFVPLAVVWGVLLSMGITALTTGNQFVDRCKLIFVQPSLYPPSHYVRRLKARVIHAYTLIQVAAVVVLYVVKNSVIGILFPIFVALLIPIRAFLLPRFFSEHALDQLDAEELPEDEDEGMDNEAL